MLFRSFHDANPCFTQLHFQGAAGAERSDRDGVSALRQTAGNLHHLRFGAADIEAVNNVKDAQFLCGRRA